MKKSDRDNVLAVSPIQPAYRQVAEQLRVSIINGKIPFDSKLPKEEELQQIFGVSRSTIREALRVLSSQHLIKVTRGVGGGAWAARPAFDEIGQYLEMSIGLLASGEDVTLQELIEFRGLLEVPAAGLAAERRTDHDLEILLAATTKELRTADDKDSYMNHHIFHQRVMTASGNDLLKMVADPMVSTLRTLRLREKAPSSFWDTAAEEHRRIYEQIEGRNVEGARREMRLHLETLAKTEVGLLESS